MTLRTFVVNGSPVQVGGRWTLDGIEARQAVPNIGLTNLASVWDDLGYDVANLGLPFVTPVAEPTYDTTTHKCIEIAPVQVGGLWVQAWQVTALTDAEKSEAYAAQIPKVVTMRQARLALLGAGLLSQVNAAVAAMPGAEGDAARIEWEFAAELKRDNPLVVALGDSLGLTSVQIDNLFVSAEAL